MDAQYRARQNFLLALASALVNWQLVEGATYEIFGVLMKGAKPKLISTIFHHVQSFDSRIQLVDRCAYFAISNPELAAQWTELRKRLEKQTAIRNQLVHFSYQIEHNAGVITHMLSPSHFNAIYAIRDKWRNPDFRIDLERLRQSSRAFNELAKALHALHTDLAAIAE